MIDFEQFAVLVKTNIEAYLKAELGTSVHSISADLSLLGQNTKADLQQWTNDLVAGKMSKADFESLVRGEVGLVKMVALERLGLTQVRLDELRAGILKTLVDTAFMLL
jgi:hypothetical protein